MRRYYGYYPECSIGIVVWGIGSLGWCQLRNPKPGEITSADVSYMLAGLIFTLVAIFAGQARYALFEKDGSVRAKQWADVWGKFLISSLLFIVGFDMNWFIGSFGESLAGGFQRNAMFGVAYTTIFLAAVGIFWMVTTAIQRTRGLLIAKVS